MKLHILKRKPRWMSEMDYVLVDRGLTDDQGSRWVVGCVSRLDKDPVEWVWGHYFHSLDEALAFFNDRP